MFVCCECCVLSGRGLCDGLIIRPEKSYRLWCVLGCDLETSKMRRARPALGLVPWGGGLDITLLLIVHIRIKQLESKGIHLTHPCPVVLGGKF